MATFYGSDSSCLTDVGLVDVQITNPITLIAQRLARRLQTPRGGLAAFGGPADFGWDLRQYINMKMTTGTRSTAQQQIANECVKDEQVQSADVDLQVSGERVTVVINVISSAGPFQLTGDVSQFTAAEFFIS